MDQGVIAGVTPVLDDLSALDGTLIRSDQPQYHSDRSGA